MKTYPTIYALSSTGKTLVLWIEQDGDKYRASHGQQGGKIVVDEWTVAQPKNVGKKNETTGEQQAALEVAAKYEKKLKSGGYWKDVKDINGERFVEPMLAKKLSERENKVTFPAMLDRKYNGGRIVTTKNGPFSRKGESWKTIPHIFESLHPLFKKWPNLVIDGEGYNHEYRYKLNELMSVLRKTKDVTQEDLAKSEQIIRYYVYDFYGAEGVTEETGCQERREVAKRLFKGNKYIVVVDYEIVNGLDDLYRIYQSYVDDGYEGAMYRTIDAPYVHKRSADLLKVKPEDSSEGIITNIHEGEGNWSGLAAKATLQWKDKGFGVGADKTFDATFKGTEEQKATIWQEQKKWLGKEVTFLYNGLTGYKIPNFARIDVNNCFKQ